MISHRRRKTQKKNFLGVLLISLASVLILLIIIFRHSIKPPDLDENGCIINGEISLTVVLIDQSDPISERSQAFLRNRLEAIKANTPTYGALEVYALGTDIHSLLHPVITVCKPVHPSKAQFWKESRVRIEKQWEENFEKRLQDVFDSMLAPDQADFSPIFESIQSISITTLNHHRWKDKPKHLIIISDFLQYTPDFSHYSGPGDFRSFSQSNYYNRVKTNLKGADEKRMTKVTLFYLPRKTSLNVQREKHENFWKDYFLHQKANEEIEIIIVQG